MSRWGLTEEAAERADDVGLGSEMHLRLYSTNLREVLPRLTFDGVPVVELLRKQASRNEQLVESLLPNHRDNLPEYYETTVLVAALLRALCGGDDD